LRGRVNAAPGPPPTSDEDHRTVSSARRILVVDDDPQIAAMLNDVLMTWGYAVQVAGTGPDAIRVVPRFRPHVVLLDLAVPGIPGELVLDCLLAADPRLPIIVLTTDQGDPDLAPSVYARGAYDLIVKPLDMARLRLVVMAALAFPR
jgi:DNA-binding NtrC family response regulator